MHGSLSSYLPYVIGGRHTCSRSPQVLKGNRLKTGRKWRWIWNMISRFKRVNDQVPCSLFFFWWEWFEGNKNRKTVNWNLEVTPPKKDTSNVRKFQQTINSPKLDLFHLPSRFIEKLSKKYTPSFHWILTARYCGSSIITTAKLCRKSWT